MRRPLSRCWSALLGIHLSFVGIIPVSTNEFLHDRASTGAVFAFIVILATSRWMLRGMHGVIGRASRRVGLGLVATAAPYIAGFINLAAFELIVFAQVFYWLLLFARTIGRPADEPARTAPVAGRAARAARSSSRPACAADHVAMAAHGPQPVRQRLRPAVRPRRSIRSRRRVMRGQTARRPEPEHPGTHRSPPDADAR